MDDETNIRRALQLAERGWGVCSPNPMVGAVIVRDDTVVGEGWHEGPGEPHAEVVALAAAGELAKGATLYCTLEPCDHFGRTPPCTQVILAAGVSRVVVAVRDPNPVVDGRGSKKLSEAGVSVAEGVLEDEAGRLIEAYAKHVTTGKPFVTLKMAATLDGKIAAADGSSTWITGEPARAEVQRLRAGSDAILVGAGTVIADDPRLTVRHDHPHRTPLRVVIDGSGRVPATAKVLSDEAPSLFATTGRVPASLREAWRDAGAEVVLFEPGPEGHVPLPEVMQALGKRDIQSVLVEGGSRLAGAAVGEGVVDKVIFFLAPKLLGGSSAPGILGETGIRALSGAADLDIVDVSRVGQDIEVEAYVHRHR